MINNSNDLFSIDIFGLTLEMPSIFYNTRHYKLFTLLLIN